MKKPIKIAFGTLLAASAVLAVGGGLYMYNGVSYQGIAANKNAQQMKSQHQYITSFLKKDGINFAKNKIVVANKSQDKAFFDDVKRIIFDFSNDGINFKRVVVEDGQMAIIEDILPKDDKTFYFKFQVEYISKPKRVEAWKILPKNVASNPRPSRFVKLSPGSNEYKAMNVSEDVSKSVDSNGKPIKSGFNFGNINGKAYISVPTPYEMMSQLSLGSVFDIDFDKYSSSLKAQPEAKYQYNLKNDNTQELQKIREKKAKKTINFFNGKNFIAKNSAGKEYKTFEVTKLKVDGVLVDMSSIKYFDKAGKELPKNTTSSIYKMEVKPKSGKWEVSALPTVPVAPYNDADWPAWVKKYIRPTVNGKEQNILEDLNGLREAFIKIGTSVTKKAGASKEEYIKYFAFGRSIASSIYIEGHNLDENGKQVGKTHKFGLINSWDKVSTEMGINFNDVMQFRGRQKVVTFQIEPLKWLKALGFSEIQPAGGSFTIGWVTPVDRRISFALREELA